MCALLMTSSIVSTSGAIDGPMSIIYDQAEIRQHGQKEVILELMGVKAP